MPGLNARFLSDLNAAVSKLKEEAVTFAVVKVPETMAVSVAKSYVEQQLKLAFQHPPRNFRVIPEMNRVRVEVV